MVIKEIKIYGPERQAFNVGQKEVKSISVDRECMRVTVIYEDRKKRSIVGFPYEAVYVPGR